MAASHGIKTKFYADAYDLSAYFTSLSAPMTIETAQTQGFGSTAKTYVIGLEDAQFTAEGIFDGVVTTGQNALINSWVQSATQKLLSFYPQGDAIGNPVRAMMGDISAYDPSSNLTDAVKFSLTAQSSVGIEGGLSLHPLSAETTAGSAAAVDNTVSSANGGSGYIHCTALVGTATIKVQHSVDNVTYADLITFTVTAAGAQRTALAAGTTVNRYTRDNHTPGTSITYASHFARK